MSTLSIAGDNRSLIVSAISVVAPASVTFPFFTEAPVAASTFIEESESLSQLVPITIALLFISGGSIHSVSLDAIGEKVKNSTNTHFTFFIIQPDPLFLSIVYKVKSLQKETMELLVLCKQRAFQLLFWVSKTAAPPLYSVKKLQGSVFFSRSQIAPTKEVNQLHIIPQHAVYSAAGQVYGAQKQRQRGNLARTKSRRAKGYRALF